jgi:hypothetical protein
MQTPSSTDIDRHRGPSLAAVAIVYVVLFIASVALPTAIAGGEHFPSPFAATGDAARYFAEHRGAVSLAVFLQFGSAIPLGILVAGIASRLQFLGLQVTGVHMTLVGGVLAAMFQATSACIEWVLVQPGAADIHSLHLLQFATGGPGFVVPFGLFIAGAAVTSGLAQLAPRWVMFTGLVISAIAELSSFTYVADGLAILLPIARFTGFAWLIAIAFVLPKYRPATAIAREVIAPEQSVPR